MTKATKISKIIGAKIELNRKLQSKTRGWLAKKIKISYQQVQNYEIGRHRVSSETLWVIAELLKTPIEQFFPDKNDKSK